MSDLARLLFGVALLATLLLVSFWLSSSSWLWLLLAAVVFLAAYVRTGVYALLVVGALLAGASVGILLEVALRWSGAFLVGVGTGLATVEAIEERPRHWPLAVGLAFVGLGMLVGVFDAGWPAVLIVSLAVGGALAWRLLRPRRDA